MAKASPQPVPLIPLIAGLMVFIIAFHLGSAATGREFVRATHLGTALEYAQGRIDLLHPTIVGFNATGTPTAQELPLWQALTAAVFKMTGSTWYGWGNVVSLLLFSTGLWPFMQLGRWYVGERAARWGLAFLLFQPDIIVMAGEAATDGLCVVLSIWFLFSPSGSSRRAAWPGGLRPQSWGPWLPYRSCPSSWRQGLPVSAFCWLTASTSGNAGCNLQHLP